jgi:site-specific DNA recombinase
VIAREFAQSESAKAQGRKQFGAMLQFLRQNPDCRVIIAEKTDRLCRNMHDFVAVEDLVEELEAEVHLIKEGQIIKKQARSQDKLIQGIFALLARNYILNMQEEIQKGQLVKAEKGQYPGRARFGYTHDLASRTTDAKRGPVVTLMFDLYATGTYSIPSLRKVIRDTTGEAVSRAYCYKKF